MNFRIALTIVLLVALTAVLGCSKDSGKDNHDGHDHAPGEAHSDDDGHDHSDDEDQHHADDDGHDHSDHDDHGHGDGGTSLGAVTIGGTTLEVSVGGEPHPNETLHVDLAHTAGPLPGSVRVWFGEKSGVGSMKGKGMGHNGSYHADAEVPGKVTPSMKLWIEVEHDGKRSSGSLAVD